jgi:chemotaxis methyl-accepting protein methylase
MNPQDRENAEFLKWALSKTGCRWAGFRKPANQVMKRIRRRMNDLNVKNLHEYRRLLNKQRAFLDGVQDKLKDGGFLITGKNEALPDTGYLTRQHHTIPVYQKKSSTGRD